MKTIFAFDFSINKPAMCVFHNNKIDFYTWPLSIDNSSYQKLINCNINVINRNLESINKKEYDSNSLVLEHVKRSSELVTLIVDTILKIVNDNNIDINDVIISSEGLSFASNGDATLNLAAYKQCLLNKLYENGFTNIKTYSPITIKSIAGCSKKGSQSKTSMIDAINNITNIDIHNFLYTIVNNSENLKKKTAFIPTVDDLVDSFWCLKTTIIKENLNDLICILQ